MCRNRCVHQPRWAVLMLLPASAGRLMTGAKAALDTCNNGWCRCSCSSAALVAIVYGCAMEYMTTFWPPGSPGTAWRSSGRLRVHDGRRQYVEASRAWIHGGTWTHCGCSTSQQPSIAFSSCPGQFLSLPVPVRAQGTGHAMDCLALQLPRWARAKLLGTQVKARAAMWLHQELHHLFCGASLVCASASGVGILGALPLLRSN